MRMKKRMTIMTALLLSIVMVLPMTVSAYAVSIQEKSTLEKEIRTKMVTVFDNSDGVVLNEVKELHDFDNNVLYAAECTPTGYFIYDAVTDTIIESSERGVSPYLNQVGDLYYGGPTYYYSLQNGQYIHTVDETEILTASNVEIIRANCHVAYSAIESKAAIQNYSPMTREIAADDITVDHPEFFQNLAHCGYMSIGNGICGFIALGMIIAYNDKYVDDNIMDNVYWEDNTKTLLNSSNTTGITPSAANVISKKLYDLDPKDSTTAIHIHDVSEEYLDEVGLLANHTSRVKPFFTEGTVRNHIDDGIPVILFGNVPYQYQDGTCNHAVVAYGYSADKDSFIVHYGWESSYYPDVKIDLGYFSLGSIYAFELD